MTALFVGQSLIALGLAVAALAFFDYLRARGKTVLAIFIGLAVFWALDGNRGWAIAYGAAAIIHAVVISVETLSNRASARRNASDADTVVMDPAERDNRDDATEEMLLAGMDALRATPPAEDLAGPVVTVAADERPMVAAPWPAIGMRHQRPPVAPWRPAWGVR